MSVRSARKWQSGPLPSQAKPEHRWRTRPDPFDGVWEDEIEPLLRNDPTGKLKATTIIDCPSTKLRRPSSIPGGSARPSCAPCNDDCRPLADSGGGRCMVRIRRCTSPRCIRRDGRPSSTHPLRGTQGDYRRPVLPPPAVQLILSHSGWRYAEVAAARPSWRCSRDCRMPSGPWAAFQRWCAATIPRLPLTNCAAAAAALLTTLRRPAGPLWPPLHPHQSGRAHGKRRRRASTPTTA